MTSLSPEMIKKLHEKALEDGKSFPLQVNLTIGGEAVSGFLYEDGTFGEGEETPRESNE